MSAVEHVNFALGALQKAVQDDQPFSNAIRALDAIRWAANCPLTPEATELEPELQSLCSAVSPIIAAIVDPHISDDLVYWGFGAAGWLFHPEDDGLRSDRYSLAVVLLAELTSLHHRNELAQRGNRLQRLVHCRRAMNEPYDPQMPLN
jgi:hypothetical protein